MPSWDACTGPCSRTHDVARFGHQTPTPVRQRVLPDVCGLHGHGRQPESSDTPRRTLQTHSSPSLATRSSGSAMAGLATRGVVSDVVLGAWCI